MREYIYIKRKTVRRIVALTVFLIVAAVATMTLLPLFLQRPVVRVETLSRNTLVVNDQERVYFRGIDTDSTFLGLTFDKDSVRYATPTHLSSADLTTVLEKTSHKLAKRLKYLENARKEMGYYMSIHSVQDEGYDMVVAYDDELNSQITQTKKLIDTLASVNPHQGVAIVRMAVRTQEALQKPSGLTIECMGGRWYCGRWTTATLNGAGITTDAKGRIVKAVWKNDTIITGQRTDSLGTYSGQMDRWATACGHGRFAATDGSFYEGHWDNNRRDGFGFAVSNQKLRAGEWRADVFRGERMQYTSERIYGIDISKHQHEKGRKRYSIQWNRLRITNLGKVGSRNVRGTVDYPVSFVYIKSTEGTTVRNRYYAKDYTAARRNGFRVGAYHFFSLRSSATAQANYFVRHTYFRSGDMPPVLDVEPTDEQIKKLGGAEILFTNIRAWMNIVHRRTGVRPVLYVSQNFVNKYLSQAPDIKRNYNVWIARYGEYKPDVKLVYWQLCADGKVAGITGDVDVNVFNGYRDKYNEFIGSETIK